MPFVKIINLQNNGVFDYKGIDLDKIVAGSQAYDQDNKLVYVEYSSNKIPNHSDLSVVTTEEYQEAISKRDKEREEQYKLSPEYKIQVLEEENQKLKENQADLWELILFGGDR